LKNYVKVLFTDYVIPHTTVWWWWWWWTFIKFCSI